MQVNCTNIKCAHLTVFNTCGKCDISLNYAGVCCSFTHYITTQKYQEPYYVAVKMANGKIGRALKFGRKLEIFGYTFFTSDNYKLAGDRSLITEERTGMSFDTITEFKLNYAAFKALESEKPACSSYPLCEYDENIKGYIPKEEGGITVGI